VRPAAYNAAPQAFKAGFLRFGALILSRAAAPICPTSSRLAFMMTATFKQGANGAGNHRFTPR
jgi:hypothetical protein